MPQLLEDLKLHCVPLTNPTANHKPTGQIFTIHMDLQRQHMQFLTLMITEKLIYFVEYVSFFFFFGVNMPSLSMHKFSF